MQKYYLRFIDSKVQSSFDLFQESNFNIVFAVYTYFYTILYVIDLIDKLFIHNDDSFQLYGSIRIVLIFIQLICYFFLKKRPYNQKSIFIVVIGLLNSIYCIERFNIITVTRLGFFFDGFALALHTMIPQLALDYAYIPRLLFSVALLIYLKIRIQDFNNPIYIFSILAIILTFIILYIVQRSKMKYYLNNYQNQIQLEQIKNILYQHMPFSIIILSRDYIQDQGSFKFGFTNSKFNSLIQNQYINQIQQDQIGDCEKISQNFENVCIEKQVQNIIINVQKKGSQNKYQTIDFYQFLNQIFIDVNNHENSFQFQFLQNFNNQNNVKVEEENKKYYKLQVVDCIWKDQPSKMVIIKNFTKQKQASALQQINEYKDEILATVSHDLKTPINGIVAQIDTINNNSDKRSIQNVLEIIKINVKLLLYLVYDIQDYSQIIKQKIKIISSTFSIAQIIQESLQLIKFQADIKNIQIHHNLEDITALLIINDPIRLKQILLNLLSNSLKCTRSGYIKINIKDLEHNTLLISVEDSGIGMSQEQLSKLFMKFNSYNNDKSQHGVGLGLSITKHLIEMMGPVDKITVTSQVNKGTCFSFQIYKNLQQNDKQIQSQNNLHLYLEKRSSQIQMYQIDVSSPDIEFEFNKSSDKKGINQIYQQQYKHKVDLNQEKKEKFQVLVVDDDVFCLLAFQAICQQFNYFEVYKSFSGQEAIDLVHSRHYDIIFIDVNMPVMDGIETATRIKQCDCNNIIVFLSGNSENYLNQLNITFPFLSICKPIDLEKFKQILEQIKKIMKI